MYIKNIFSIFTLVFFIQALIASDAYSFSHDKLLKDLNTIGKVIKKEQIKNPRLKIKRKTIKLKKKMLNQENAL